MFDIDYFTYRKEPFTVLNTIGIHPLDDKGLEKYLSKDSYTHSYLKRTSPYIIESILKNEEEGDAENKKSQEKFSTINQESKSTKTKKNSVEKKTKSTLQKKSKNLLNTPKKNLINNTQTITEGCSGDKTRLLNQKYNFQSNKNFKRRNYFNENRNEEYTSKTLRNNGLAVSMDKTNFNQRYKLKLHRNQNKLPLIMSQHNAKNTISLITSYSKEMGENYNPYAFISPPTNRTKRNYVGGLYHC